MCVLRSFLLCKELITEYHGFHGLSRVSEEIYSEIFRKRSLPRVSWKLTQGKFLFFRAADLPDHFFMLKYTISTAMSAGETPEMRSA